MTDPELEAMQALSQAFDGLESDTQIRILRWAADKYASGEKLRAQPIGTPTDTEISVPTENESRATLNGSVAPEDFEHFADLYDAASPKSNADKALVAGYWFQKQLGNSAFGSQALNTELKNLGHGLQRINDALATNAKQKPALVLQVRKGGSAPQARKTYKLTAEGIRKVERMISGRDE
ncbi:hypothetical protein [Actinomadura verrucosospora]